MSSLQWSQTAGTPEIDSSWACTWWIFTPLRVSNSPPHSGQGTKSKSAGCENILLTVAGILDEFVQAALMHLLHVPRGDKAAKAVVYCLT